MELLIIPFSIGFVFFWLFFMEKDTRPTPELTPHQKCESWIEHRLLTQLLRKGYKVDTQVPCGKYRIDIVLTDYKIAIECDGKEFHSTPDQKRYDKNRSNYLRKHGYSVWRFTGSQIMGDMEKTMKTINKRIYG